MWQAFASSPHWLDKQSGTQCHHSIMPQTTWSQYHHSTLLPKTLSQYYHSTLHKQPGPVLSQHSAQTTWSSTIIALCTNNLVQYHHSTLHKQPGPVPSQHSATNSLIPFDFKMTFEQHLRNVSTAASQWHAILWKSWRVCNDILQLDWS